MGHGWVVFEGTPDKLQALRDRLDPDVELPEELVFGAPDNLAISTPLNAWLLQTTTKAGVSFGL